MDNHSDLAELIRRACLDAAREAYEDGGLRGLCGEGRWEYAMDAVRQLDLRELITRFDRPEVEANDAPEEGAVP